MPPSFAAYLRGFETDERPRPLSHCWPFAAYLRGFETAGYGPTDDYLWLAFAAYLRGFETTTCHRQRERDRGLQPTYEDLKQNTRARVAVPARPFAAYLRGFETGADKVRSARSPMVCSLPTRI